ncbi:MAG: MarR family transcriptional regulator [Planctomycetota bacterium]|jgi:DNA-binding MarR family transcriptional regulator
MGQRYGDVRKAFNLSPHQFALLYHIRVLGSTHLSGLQRFLPGHLSGIGQMVDRLVQGGWLQRKPDTEDRRRLLVSLTEKAQDALKSIEPFGMARAYMEIRGMDRKGRREAVKSLKNLAALMGVDPSKEGASVGNGGNGSNGSRVEIWPFQ